MYRRARNTAIDLHEYYQLFLKSSSKCYINLPKSTATYISKFRFLTEAAIELLSSWYDDHSVNISWIFTSFRISGVKKTIQNKSILKLKLENTFSFRVIILDLPPRNMLAPQIIGYLTTLKII